MLLNCIYSAAVATHNIIDVVERGSGFIDVSERGTVIVILPYCPYGLVRDDDWCFFSHCCLSLSFDVSERKGWAVIVILPFLLLMV